MQNFEALTRSNMEFVEQAMRMFSPFGAQQGRPGGEGEQPAGPRPVPTPEAPRGAPGKLSEDLDALQRQLREMQAQLEKLTRDKG